MVAALPDAPQWLQVTFIVSLAVAAVSGLTMLAWPAKRPPLAASDGVRIGQRTDGANSPTVVGNNANITINNALPPERRDPSLRLYRRYEEAKPDGVTQTVFFTNDGNRTTHLLDVRILDADGAVVMSYKPPCDRIDPQLPANVEPGRVMTFRLKVAPEHLPRAQWFEWEGEGSEKHRSPWASRDLYIHVSGAVHGHAEVNANLTVTPGAPAPPTEPPKETK